MSVLHQFNGKFLVSNHHLNDKFFFNYHYLMASFLYAIIYLHQKSASDEIIAIAYTFTVTCLLEVIHK